MIVSKTWFEVKLKYTKVAESGSETTVTDAFLFDAVSFTDAEARVIKEATRFVKGGAFTVKNISPSNVAEVFPNDTGDFWFKAKVNLVSVDEESGREKKMVIYYLVEADDIGEALERLDTSLDYVLVPYTTTSIGVSTIVDVFPYDEVSEIM